MPRCLQLVLRFLSRPSAGSNDDCARRRQVCRQGRFPKVRQRRDGPPSPLRPPTPDTRPLGGVRDGSVLPVRTDVSLPGIGFPLLPCGNPPEKSLVAVLWTFLAFRR